MINGFQEERILGQGTYGQVFKSRRRADGRTYAMKVINLNRLNNREVLDTLNEIRLMASFQSPFIVRFYEAFVQLKKLYIVTEYAKLGDLSHLIERRKKQKRPLHEDDIWRYFLQLLLGLNEMHKNGVAHRDLKSANILIAAPDLVKIADLGVSTVLQTHELAKTQIGTPLYIAPEVWKRKPYDTKCDIWSLGVLLYEMMFFDFPFYGRSQKDLMQKICIGKFSTPKTQYSSALVLMLRRLIVVNPASRPSIQSILDLEIIKEKMELLLPFGDVDQQTDQLLSTIHMQKDMKKIHFPEPAYESRYENIKPMNERLHFKGNDYEHNNKRVSTPELRNIVDRDLWSSNKQNRTDPDINEIIEDTNVEAPRSYPELPKPILNQPKRIGIVQPSPRKKVGYRYPRYYHHVC